MSKLTENTEKITQILADIEQLPEDRYEIGKEEGRAEGRAEGESIGYENALSKRTELVVTENGTYEPQGDSTGFRIVSVNVKAISKLSQRADGSITEITEEDLQGATKIANYAFMQCSSLVTAILPNGIETIRYEAFTGCTKLEEITLPESLTRIYGDVFTNCTSLKIVKIKATKPPQIDASLFSNVHNDCVYMVGYGCGDAYKSATNWSKHADKIVEGDV